MKGECPMVEEEPPDEYLSPIQKLVCIHRGERDFGFHNGNYGDCSKCVQSNDNKLCELYTPAIIYKFYVADNQSI
jgi:hypothetical protein